jgi:LSD1 subclass zinc finger protein
MTRLRCPSCKRLVEVPAGSHGAFRCSVCGAEFKVSHVRPVVAPVASVSPASAFEGLDDAPGRPKRRRE